MKIYYAHCVYRRLQWAAAASLASPSTSLPGPIERIRNAHISLSQELLRLLLLLLLLNEANKAFYLPTTWFIYMPPKLYLKTSLISQQIPRVHTWKERRKKGEGGVVHAAARLVRVFPFIWICFSTDSLRANRFASLLSPDDAKVSPIPRRG